MAEIDATPVEVPVAEPVTEAPAVTPIEEVTEDAGAKRKLEDAEPEADGEEHLAKRAREAESNGVEVRSSKISHLSTSGLTRARFGRARNNKSYERG